MAFKKWHLSIWRGEEGSGLFGQCPNRCNISIMLKMTPWNKLKYGHFPFFCANIIIIGVNGNIHQSTENSDNPPIQKITYSNQQKIHRKSMNPQFHRKPTENPKTKIKFKKNPEKEEPPFLNKMDILMYKTRWHTLPRTHAPPPHDVFCFNS